MYYLPQECSETQQRPSPALSIATSAQLGIVMRTTNRMKRITPLRQ